MTAAQCSSGKASVRRAPVTWRAMFADWVRRRLEKRRTRRALLALNDDQLKDIGLSRSEAYGDIVQRPWN